MNRENLIKHRLDNDLRIVMYPQTNTDIANVNILYDVGAKDENENRTGFAHLFEHLMFSGSINIPEFDKVLQNAGGNNNAFTTNDITNYYITIPAINLETAFWLESDRMLSLAFSQKSLDTQKHVVIEEFKQRYLNQPYGDVWHYLRKLAYKIHPYKWPTIGKKTQHIKNITIDEVKSFFYTHYAPNNAIMVITGNINPDKTLKMIEKWFGDIEKRNVLVRNLPQEPKQRKPRSLIIQRDVPSDVVFMAFHTCGKHNKDYYATDMISDILSLGRSSRLYQKLVKEKQIFNEIEAFITGNIEPGLLVIEGILNEKISFKKAVDAIHSELSRLINTPIKEEELQKVKNKIESNYIFSNVSLQNLAMNLAYYELLGDAYNYFDLQKHYSIVSERQLIKTAAQILSQNNCSTLYYEKKR